METLFSMVNPEFAVLADPEVRKANVWHAGCDQSCVSGSIVRFVTSQSAHSARTKYLFRIQKRKGSIEWSKSGGVFLLT